MREVCMLSAKAGRDTPCWWDCGTYCKRRVATKQKKLDTEPPAPKTREQPGDVGL